jgi:hypothetical protein
LLSAHARIPDENQEEPSRVILDIADADVLKKFRNTFGSIAATLASPAGDGDVARHASNACLKRHGLHWIDVVNGFCDHQSNGGGDMAAANATIEQLLMQVAEQQVEIDELRAERASGNAQALWSSVGVKAE